MNFEPNAEQLEANAENPMANHCYIDIATQIDPELRRKFKDDDEEDHKFSDDEDLSDEEENEEDAEAHRLAMEMMMSGEHPDAEIDKLLESFGVQISQIGLLPTDKFFKGQIPENDARLT